MWNFNYDSPAAIKQLLQENSLVMSKKFGQNFMIDTHARARLTELAAATADTEIWEIGPGIGALTSSLLKSGAKLTAFEIDRGFCRVLSSEAFADEPNFTLIEGDFLKTWEAVFKKEGAPDLLFSNLPYNVGSVCIARILEEGCLPQKMVFTLQTEVAQRLNAKEGSKMWSSLSILVQADYTTRINFSIPGSCFFPRPNVGSSVITLTKREQSLVPSSLRPVFLEIVRTLFSQKRKTLKNNLSAIAGDAAQEMLVLAGIDPNERAENLTIANLVSLCAVLKNA